MSDFEVAIVGGGPAGLLAAMELGALLPGARICVIDRGARPQDRDCRLAGPACTGCQQCELVQGFGGAGFYVDGKLCEDAEAGQRWDSVPTSVVGETAELLDRLREEFGVDATMMPPDPGGRVARDAQARGFEVTAYPVKFMGTDRVRTFASRLVAKLETSGVQIMPRTDVVDVRPADGTFDLVCAGEGGLHQVSADRVLLSVGRSGASWLQDMADRVGIRLTPANIDLGLRLEARSGILRPLTLIGGNPKLKFQTGGTYVKTHCLCPDGFVISYRVKFDDLLMSVVDGHSFHGQPSSNSNVNLLMRIDSALVSDPVTYAHSIAWNTNLVGKGSPVIQRLRDLREGRPSMEVNHGPEAMQPTMTVATRGDLNLTYPRAVVEGILNHIEALDGICPGVASDDVVLYGPALEWAVGRPELSPEFETNVEGMYMAGDATGRTSGVLTAAATGIHAARCLAGSL